MSSLTSKLADLSPRAWALIAGGLALVLVVSSAGIYYAYQEAQPTSATLNLQDGAREVPTNQPLTITLSRAASLGAFKAAFHLDPVIDGDLTPGTRAQTSAARTASGARDGIAGNAFTWTPTTPWGDLTRYTVRVDAFRDAGGHPVKGVRWTFTTTIVPKVVALATDSGTVLADGAELPVNSDLKASFNTTMNEAVTKILVNGLAAELTWDAEGRSAGLALKGMKLGPVEFGLAPGGKDTSGRPLSPDWKLAVSLVFKVNVHTVPLKFPALIQIPNDPAARDQSGLQAADVVWEYATEGGITRMTALFTNAPDVVGPTRSGRLISFSLTRHYQGMLFLSGLSAGSFGRLLADPVPTFFDTQGYFYRSRDRFLPDNLYINGDAVARAEAPASRPPITLHGGRVPITAGDSGNSAAVSEHNSSYSFDPATGTYTKTEDNHLMGDASLGQPLHVQLLIVMHTTSTTTPYEEDVNGVHGLDFNTESGGRADFYYKGFHATGKWSSPDRSSPFKFETDSGQAVGLPPGLTWVDVVRN